MRKISFILMLLLLASCEEMSNLKDSVKDKYDSVRENRQKDTYDEVVETYTDPDIRSGIEYSKAVNDLMSGPTVIACPDVTNQTSEEVSEEVPVVKVSVETTYPLSIGTRVVGDIKGEPQVMWDECGGKIRSNYVGNGKNNRCANRKVSKEFINFFDKNFNRCAQESYLKMKGFSNLEKLGPIKFSHDGITGDTRHKNKSYHSVNRAIDIDNIKMTYDGKEERLDVSNQKKNPTKKFYDGLRSCWDKAIKNYKGNCPGSYPKGSLGHENKYHKTHLHLSLPYCPRSGYFLK